MSKALEKRIKRYISLLLLLFLCVSIGQAHAFEFRACKLSNADKRSLIRDHLYGGLPERESRVYVRRAYAITFDNVHKVPKWAAWRAQKEYLNVPKRESRWKTIRPDYEKNTPYPSEYSGWAQGPQGIVRGHIVPYYISGGDRNHNQKLATFKDDLQINDNYDACTVFEVNSMINIAPQYRTNFDSPSGLWGRLENDIRKFVSDGRLFQIYAGTIFTDSKKSLIGNVKVAPEARDIAIPHGYFKIIIDLQRKESVAFLFDHEIDLAQGCALNTSSLIECIRPIEYIEAATGLEFFRNLSLEDNKALRGSSTKDIWEAWNSI